MTIFKKPKFSNNFRPSQLFCESKSTTPESIGTFKLKINASKFLEINEQHYQLPDGSMGLNIIPIVDREGNYGGNDYDNYPTTKDVSGIVEVVGCELLDAAIRQACGIKTTTPITAILTYLHFQYGEGTLRELSDPRLLKTEASQTHSALYNGQGKTRNSPFTYHGKRLQVVGYPAHAYVVKVADVDQNNFLINWNVASRLINETNGGVQFPDDYKKDNYHLTNLQQIFEHYRGWIDKEWVNSRINPDKTFNQLLREANVFALYCCEYTTFSLNLALNLVFNEAGFVKVFGSDGLELWEKTKASWRELTGEEIPQIHDFKTLWESDGETNPLMKDEVGRSLAFKPQNTADLISSFMQMYAAWPSIGVGLSSAVCLGFLPEIQNRTGLSTDKLTPLFFEVIALMAFYDSCTRENDHLAGLNEISTVVSSDELSNYLRTYLTSEQNLKKRIELMQNGTPTIERAYKLYLEEISAFRLKLDHLSPENDFADQLAAELSDQTLETHVQFYSPPAIFHRIATSTYPSHNRVTIEAVGTVMDYSDVVHVNANQNTQIDQTIPARGTK